MALLRRKEAMGYTTVVTAAEDASLGERYATIAAAAAVGERTRDQGGHALVVIDDLACMVRSLDLQHDREAVCPFNDPLWHVLEHSGERANVRGCSETACRNRYYFWRSCCFQAHDH